MNTEIHDALDLAFKKFDSFQTLWTIYVTVILGFLGYLASAPNSTRSELVRVVLAIGFILFTTVNLQGLLAVQDERERLRAVAVATVEKQQLEEVTKMHLRTIADRGPPERWALITFHVASDVLVVLTILILPSALIKFGPPSGDLLQAKPAKSPLPEVLLKWNQTSRVWVLAEEYVLDLTESGVSGANYRFCLPKDYSFDLASVPRWLWWLIAPNELSIVAPLIHDYIYECKGQIPGGRIKRADGTVVTEFTRAETDDLFAILMKIEGVSRWRRFFAYNAVHIVGGVFWSSSSTVPSFAPKAAPSNDATKPTGT